MTKATSPANLSKTIASSTLWQFASQIVMAALSIVTVKFVAIGLTKELAGNYNSAYGYLQIFGILADFGLYAVAVREVSKAENKERVLGALFVLRCGILAVSLGSALLIAWLVPMWQGSPLPLAISIAAFVPALTLIAGLIRTVFQVKYKMHYVFIAEVTQRIITVSLIGAFIAAGVRQSVDVRVCYAFLAVGGVGSLWLLVLSVFFSRNLIRIRPCFDRVLLASLLKKAAPYGIAFLCVALYRQFDVALIALLRPDYELQNAYYGFVQRMMDMAYLLPTFLLNSTLPMLSERDARGEDTRGMLGKTLLIVLIIGVISLLFAALWSRPLTDLLTTPAYLSQPGQPGSDTALFILSVPMFCNGIILFGFYTLLTKNAWKPLVLSMLVGVAVALGCNLWLIPQWGFVGAAVTSVVVHAVLAVLLLPQALRRMPARFPAKYVLQLLLFTGLLGGILWTSRTALTGSLATGAALVGMGVVLIGLLYVTGLKKSCLEG